MNAAVAELLARAGAADPALAQITEGGDATVCVPEPGWSTLVAELALAPARGGPLVAIVPARADAERMAFELASLIGAERVAELPAWETLPFERVSPSTEVMGRRAHCLWRLGSGVTPAERRAVAVVVVPVRSALQRLAPGVTRRAPVRIGCGDAGDPAELVARLVAYGYRREYQVEHHGEVALRGGIVDVFGPSGPGAVRIEFAGDVVESVRALDVSDQRSKDPLSVASFDACRELLPEGEVAERARALVESAPWAVAEWERIGDGVAFDGMESWLPWLAPDEELVTDLLADGARVLVFDPHRGAERARALADEESMLAEAIARTWGTDPGDFPRLHLPYDRLLAACAAPVTTVVPLSPGPSTPSIAARAWDRSTGVADEAAGRIAALVGEGFRVVVCADGEGSAARLHEVLALDGLDAPFLGAAQRVPDGPCARIAVAGLDRGCVLSGQRLALVAEADLTGRRRVHRRGARQAAPAVGFFDDLEPGGYVVHRTHGIARYAGMVTREIGGASRDYLLLEYRGSDRLYVPTDQIGVLTPYAGGETPALSRMGGADWARTTARVRSAVAEIAADLVELYRERATAEGHAFAPDGPWAAELATTFGFVETRDQLGAIADVSADMEEAKPMDRLVCGDVGFGKTEVAVRAAFKAVADGMQVAVLVPTTLLARQHHATFAERLSGFPVRVEMLSRFLSDAEARRVVAGLADGTVDVVVGTHRLLGADVSFRRLGLVVVDEEQRFGVEHKEALKRLRRGVDVLTLSASPIPRTLELSLTGIRDMSLITTPPAARLPILTFVGPHDDRAVSEAIRRELIREGQVFYVYNRIAGIDDRAKHVADLVPEARIAIAHGRMDEAQLERVVVDFTDGAYDVLVCTTIIESGIDMPTVNTLVVDGAHRLGLGQLHQLRGRVGRAHARGYAYFLHPPDRTLSESAYERLRTIGEETELGSGFRLAMRDLEIRGAGNLLGGAQHGHIAAVGYDLYVQLVHEAVSAAKGEPVRTVEDVTLDLDVDAYLPPSYIARDDLRLEAYRRLAAARDAEAVADVAAEWAERYGPPPPPVSALVEVGRLRAEALRLGVRSVAVREALSPAGERLFGRRVALVAPLALPASAQVRLRRLVPGGSWREAGGELEVPMGELAAHGPGRSSAAALAALLAELLPA